MIVSMAAVLVWGIYSYQPLDVLVGSDTARVVHYNDRGWFLAVYQLELVIAERKPSTYQVEVQGIPTHLVRVEPRQISIEGGTSVKVKVRVRGTKHQLGPGVHQIYIRITDLNYKRLSKTVVKTFYLSDQQAEPTP